MIKNFVIVCIYLSFVLISQSCIAQTEISDTITLDEKSLDSINFYLSKDFSRSENKTKGTLHIRINDTIYKIPYNVTSTAIPIVQRGRQYFRMTGLSLDEDSLGYYLQELFRNPREKLRYPINSIDWKNSDIYRRYFEPYDMNSEYLITTKEKSSDLDNSEDEFESFLTEGTGPYVVQNYENFPLPQTIDLEVDLKKMPRSLSVLDLEFNFDKLTPEFQRLLLNYGNSSSLKYQNRRSIDPKNE